MTRIIWRRAHPVRLSDRVNTKPHRELWAAYRAEKLTKEIAELISDEVDRDFRQEAR